MKDLISLKLHNEMYIERSNIDFWIEHNNKHKNDDVFNNEEIKLKDLLNNNKNIRKTAIDIGSGAGWLSSKLSEYFDNIISIEPSKKAIDICKNLYKNEKINWIEGFPEDILPTLNLEDPILVVTCSVFQHLNDDDIEETLNWINTIPLKNSILGFQELWGDESHQSMHHIRNKDWWSLKLNNWELDFHGPEVLKNVNKGIHGKKIK